MEEFEFIERFADVDLLKVEAIGKVIGRVIGVLMLGMMEAGLSEDRAQTIIDNTIKTIYATTFRGPTDS